MTYALLNVPFLLLAVVALVVARVRTGRPAWKPLAGTMAVLLVLTAIFDNFMIMAGLVAYDDAQRIGLQIGVAPIEDFAYAVLAVILLPALWHLIAPWGGRRSRAAAASSSAGSAGGTIGETTRRTETT
ncbi:lycopene e-cyclase isoprenoid transferase B [Actinotalea ferrariae CF5-4]|uniref:Lycopene e-cyclase isoprenoid transferase B n=1 Tax=Actinotalea ferrariae CF5-4 TaxID=948458 RepID=A0A021VQ58_9CELL|nr:lycopene cyclase domain-containing protein [Actinotalea ferrariae]EYR63309.1 lycopene e-cyclase isoprenoid transferase B [Actinotalea ferrariae CF5-4]